ncbi:hypothetical protein RvY_04257 [Ramazzottius varieornatus]|uniref:Uncharacterized protein n=1 Tax=Ramazzottius varieornatus TaxID=947166 RepID=A0A1D1UQZ8_RAMVA|nr:hypothetical protein RvY_04257 [Ramazzottius varieornatus]
MAKQNQNPNPKPASEAKNDGTVIRLHVLRVEGNKVTRSQLNVPHSGSTESSAGRMTNRGTPGDYLMT